MLNYVKIGDKNLPIYFGWNALRIISSKTGMSIENIQFHFGEKFDWTITTIHVALKEGARKTQGNFKASEQDVADWLDADSGAIKRVSEELAKQLEQLFPEEEGDGEGDSQEAGEKNPEAPE